MSSEPTVFVIDDDELARASVCTLVRSMGIRAEQFSSAEEFLDHYVEGLPGCLITDLRMLGMSGLELQEKLNDRDIHLPLVVITAYAQTSLTVRAMRNGALSVLEKPCVEHALWDAIRKALAQDVANRSAQERRQELRARIATLAPTERKVMDLIVAGKPNKVIARELDISIRTVERCLCEVLRKVQTDSVAGLVRLAIDADMDR